MTGLTPHEFALTRAEERWVVEGGEPRLVELRGESGRARVVEQDGLARIEARSEGYFPTSSSYGGSDDRLFASILDTLPPSLRFHVRRVLLTRAVTTSGTTVERTERLVTIRGGAAGIVLPLDGRAAGIALDLAEILGSIDRDARTAPWRDVPIAWLRGSGSILLHEAIGHPAEAGAKPLTWPRWLRVVDDPRHDGIGAMEVDDTGRATESADLTLREAPRNFRREGFRDLPLRRMTNLVVMSADEIAVLPKPRIEVLLLGGGRWDPASDEVEIRVAAARLVDGPSSPVFPFTWRAKRTRIPSLLLGAHGEPAAYPGVLCSNEGQRIAVGSWAPAILTRELS